MSVIDLEKLLEPVSAESPCGKDLEYDPTFGEMNRLAQGKPEQAMGEEVIPAEEPDWNGVKKRALEICARSKDLRVGVLLARALLGTDSWAGLQDGLAYVHGVIDRYWDGVHPELDPGDGKDPTWRLNILGGLSGPDTFLKAIRETPLLDSPRLGRFCVRDILIAGGKIAVPPRTSSDKPPKTAQEIDGALMAAPIEDLKGTEEALSGCVDGVAAIAAAVTEKVGSATAFPELSDALRAARQPMREVLGRRGAAVSGGEAFPGAAVAGAPPSIAGEITSRDDAMRMLDKICDYFNRHEPSSPVPILIKRAKALVSKSFVDIVRDLAPGGLAEVERIRGGQE